MVYILLYLAESTIMRYLFILIFSLLIASANAQRFETNIKEAKIGTLECEYRRIVETGSDTLYIIFCSFQNKTYSHITDIGSVGIYKQERLDSLISNLERFLPYLDTEGMDVAVDVLGVCHLRKSAKFNLLFIEVKGGKYTTLSKAKVIEWIAWLKSIKLHK